MAHKWEKTYKQNKFSIKTEEPSVVVRMVSDRFGKGSSVLDLGCGGGRNSVFLAEKGCHVDAIDVADLDFRKNHPDEIREKIKFRQGTALGNFRENGYDLVVAARLFQYLSEDELEKLIGIVERSLKKGGIFVSSYNTSGGIFDKGDIDVDKYVHSIEDIRRYLENDGFGEVQVFEGGSESKYVPYEGSIKTFDIIARK